ncbi:MULTISPECIES: hypothetical protein [Streptomyces]|uniref:Uncharacterized protein n=1 Tax=Streptomyces venezuelae TaxID=54571 RepID=A0A5P2AJW2_STRVZ|nr:hypothetical protein [Streptomyces venezuelae]QES18453.1 hypothetical protein DEJ46_04535 [Streptomyces venezuelae]
MSWTLLAGGAALLLAPSIAVLRGWRPSRLARTGAPTRLLGAAGVLVYGAVPTSEVARLAGATEGVPKACFYIALGLIGCSIVLVALYDFLAEPSRRRRG